MEAALKGDLAEARRLQDRLIRLHKALFVDASPSPTKFVLARMGLCREDARLPIAPCDPARHDEILAAVELAGAAP
jgi:4-hydroxy-tetrahydrodipicolinate synthase